MSRNETSELRNAGWEIKPHASPDDYYHRAILSPQVSQLEHHAATVFSERHKQKPLEESFGFWI
jgi:hypothetical protein